MILTDLLFLLVTGLASIYPVNWLIRYWDKKKGRNWVVTRNEMSKYNRW